MDEDPFADLSDLSEDDFHAINVATQFMNLSSTTVMSGFSEINDPDKSAQAEINALRLQLALANERANQLESSMVRVQQERLTKEGEAAILRERLATLERERAEALARSSERLYQSEQSRQKIEDEYRKSLESLKAELMFKDREIEAISINMEHMKLSNKASGTTAKDRKREAQQVKAPPKDVPEGFEDFSAGKKRQAPDTKPAELEVLVKLPDPVVIAHVPTETAREILDQAFECVEYLRDIRELIDYDYKQVLHYKDQMYRILRETDCLLAALEIVYDLVLALLRQAVFIYFSRLIPTVLSLNPELGQDLYSRTAYTAKVTRAYPGYDRCQLISKMCAQLSNPTFGLHPWIFKSHLDAFKYVLLYSGHSVPLEIKDLIENAVVTKSLVNMTENENVLVDCVQLLALMSSDRTAVSLLLKSNSSTSEASLLAIIVKIGIDRFSCLAEGQADVFTLALTEFLLLLGRKGIIPLHVAFDKRFLREMLRFMVRRTWKKAGDQITELGLYIEALHCVFVESSQDMRVIIPGWYFGLHFVLEELLTRLKQQSPVHQLALSLFKKTTVVMESWLKDRDTDRIDMSYKQKIATQS